MSFDHHNELQLFEALAQDPETSQADLATRLGIAVGTVNWYIKRWTAKGYIKVSRIGRWRWHYLLTPQGMAEKARLASKYLDASMSIYRRTRARATVLLKEVSAAGYDTVSVTNDSGDIAEICALTCLELGIRFVTMPAGERIPQIVIEGYELTLVWPQDNE